MSSPIELTIEDLSAVHSLDIREIRRIDGSFTQLFITTNGTELVQLRLNNVSDATVVRVKMKCLRDPSGSVSYGPLLKPCESFPIIADPDYVTIIEMLH